MILKNESTIIVFVFIFLHLLIWTLVPAISNVNLPLDTIEALAWGSNLEWGYSKHPPVSALIVEINHFIFGSRDWAFYLLSQIFVVVSFVNDEFDVVGISKEATVLTEKEAAKSKSRNDCS